MDVALTVISLEISLLWIRAIQVIPMMPAPKDAVLTCSEGLLDSPEVSWLESLALIDHLCEETTNILVLITLPSIPSRHS